MTPFLRTPLPMPSVRQSGPCHDNIIKNTSTVQALYSLVGCRRLVVVYYTQYPSKMFIYHQKSHV